MDTDTSNLPQRNSSKAPSEALKRDKLIAQQIWLLMTHYWIADDSAAVRQAQVEDWLEDMVEFGPEIVRQACAEWRQTKARRPAPAELRTIAAQIQQREAPKAVVMEMLQSDEEVRARCAQRYFNCVGRLRERGVICFDDCRSTVCEIMGMTVDEVRAQLRLEASDA